MRRRKMKKDQRKEKNQKGGKRGRHHEIFLCIRVPLPYLYYVIHFCRTTALLNKEVNAKPTQSGFKISPSTKFGGN